MSCQQNQQQCQPPSKCTPKCTPKCPPQCSAPCPPPVSSCCGPSSGGCCGSSFGVVAVVWATTGPISSTSTDNRALTVVSVSPLGALAAAMALEAAADLGLAHRRAAIRRCKEYGLTSLNFPSSLYILSSVLEFEMLKQWSFLMELFTTPWFQTPHTPPWNHHSLSSTMRKIKFLLPAALLLALDLSPTQHHIPKPLPFPPWTNVSLGSIAQFRFWTHQGACCFVQTNPRTETQSKFSDLIL